MFLSQTSMLLFQVRLLSLFWVQQQLLFLFWGWARWLFLVWFMAHFCFISYSIRAETIFWHHLLWMVRQLVGQASIMVIFWPETNYHLRSPYHHYLFVMVVCFEFACCWSLLFWNWRAITIFCPHSPTLPVSPTSCHRFLLLSLTFGWCLALLSFCLLQVSRV